MSDLGQLEDTAMPDKPVPVMVARKYRVTDTTTESGDAITYLAEDLANDRQVNLTVLRGEAAADEEFVAAVREQAHRLAKPECAHRTLPRVYESGLTHAGEVFVAREAVAGPSLRDILDERGPLDSSGALRLAIQVGEALETLHRNGIVHGELRPESIVVTKNEDGEDAVKLVGVELTSAHRTTTGLRLRDPSLLPYLAPEQIDRAESLEASDVHALGLLLHELLTAQRPSGSGPRSRSGGYRPLVIGRIVAKALEPGPGRRYSNVSLMVNDMWSAGSEAPETVAPQPPISPPVTERRVTVGRHARSDAGLAAALVVGLVLVGATAWVVQADRRVRTEQPEITVSGSPSAPVALTPESPPPSVRAVEPPPVLIPVDPAAPDQKTASAPSESVATAPTPPAREGPPQALVGAAVRAPRPARATDRAARVAQPTSEGGDGTAIIDWLLKR